MKTRNGFVSNSSSSSFIVAYKGDNKPNAKRLAQWAGAAPGSQAEKVLAQFYDVILGGDVCESFKAYCEANYVDANQIEEGDHEDGIRKMFDAGWKILTTSVSNESDSEVEQFLYSTGGFEVDTENLKITFEGN